MCGGFDSKLRSIHGFCCDLTGVLKIEISDRIGKSLVCRFALLPQVKVCAELAQSGRFL
jgi:hypothetical protein